MDQLKLFACLIAAPLLALSASAHADIFVKEVSTGTGLASGSLLLPVSASPQNYFAGFQNIKVSATGSNADAMSFAAYCVDPAHYSSTAYQDYFSPSVAHNVAGVFVAQAADIQKLYDKYYAGTIGNNANAAAFQLALWEIANDNKNLTSGGVQKNGSTNTTLVASANTLLSNFSGYAGPQIYTLTLYQVNRGVTGAVGQDYIVASVPEPSTYAMLFAGFGFLGFAALRGTKQM